MSASRIRSLSTAALIALGASAGNADVGELKAWLEPTPRGAILELQGYVAAARPMTVSYRLTIARIGEGGRATTSQGGKVRIDLANEPTALSVTAINVGAGDSFEAELTVMGPDGETVTVEISRRPDEVIEL